MSDLPAWLCDPALRPVWDRIRARFERNGLDPRCRVQVLAATRDERHALGALLGRTVTSASVRVDLAALDRRLRERSGVGGLETVLTVLYGAPPEDRAALRTARTRARERPLELALELVNTPWAAHWVAGLRRTGLLTNRANADGTVRDAALVLQALVGASSEMQSRVELGARLLGDAHALDRDRLLHQVVLRGLAAAKGVPLPEGTREREWLWEEYGVSADLLSRTCLLWGLRLASVTDPVANRLAVATEAGDPVHLTAWDMRRVERLALSRGSRVLICENPRVVEAVAQSRVEGWAVVCTSGEPNLVVDDVLGRLAAAGAALRYHGDFDWPGVAIANRVIGRFEAEPWRMSASDYVAAVRPDGPPLVGAPVEPRWDAELGAAMRNHERAVHEESALAELVGELAAGGR